MSIINKKYKMVIIDTNICDLLYSELIKERSDIYGKEQTEKLAKKLINYYEGGFLYITESIKWEFEGRFMCKNNKIVEEFWSMFSAKTLSNSYDAMPKINVICKNVTNLYKHKESVMKKMMHRKNILKSRHDDYKVKYDKLYPDWKNGKSCEEFRNVCKVYFIRKREYDRAILNEDYLFIEDPDRIILSTAAYYAEHGYNVSIITSDVGVIVMRDQLKKEFSITVKDFRPSYKTA